MAGHGPTVPDEECAGRRLVAGAQRRQRRALADVQRVRERAHRRHVAVTAPGRRPVVGQPSQRRGVKQRHLRPERANLGFLRGLGLGVREENRQKHRAREQRTTQVALHHGYLKMTSVPLGMNRR